jgi:cytochrome c oxidase subunit 2
LEISAPPNGVIHSFWAPQLNGKTDAVPGLTNRMLIQADEEGDYYGQCAELCGLSHAYMRFVVSAVSEDEFAEWVKNQALEAVVPSTPEAQAGQQVFLTAGCVGCHTVRGEPSAQGKTGPELTHVATRPFIAGGMLTFSENNLTHWLGDPPGIKPGSLMPNLNLTPGQISSLVAYLTSLQ